MAKTDAAEALLKLPPERRRVELARMSHRQRRSLRGHWRLWAHAGQVPPGAGWHTWLIMAGRGFGKTRAGAEWVRAVAEADSAARIALVGDSLGEARRVMIEGPSGLLAIAPPRRRPTFEPSKRLLTWPNGAEAVIYSASEPESLRGPQHSHASRARPTSHRRPSRMASAGWSERRHRVRGWVGRASLPAARPAPGSL